MIDEDNYAKKLLKHKCTINLIGKLMYELMQPIIFDQIFCYKQCWIDFPIYLEMFILTTFYLSNIISNQIIVILRFYVNYILMSWNSFWIWFSLDMHKYVKFQLHRKSALNLSPYALLSLVLIVKKLITPSDCWPRKNLSQLLSYNKANYIWIPPIIM